MSHLPDPDNSVGNEDEKNNNRLDKGGGCLLSLLKQSQHLYGHKEHIILADGRVTLQHLEFQARRGHLIVCSQEEKKTSGAGRSGKEK